MTLVLTLVALVLGAVIVGLVAWEIRHRRSDLVAAWNPSTYPGRVSGGLGMLEGGAVSDRLGPHEPEVVVLVHGLGATADYFGDVYEGVGRTRRLVMPDLLGFGRSLDEQRYDFSLEAQVGALERGLDAIGVGGARLAIAGHSTGAAVALAFAARHPSRVTDVVLWSPPVRPSEQFEPLDGDIDAGDDAGDGDDGAGDDGDGAGDDGDDTGLRRPGRRGDRDADRWRPFGLTTRLHQFGTDWSYRAAQWMVRHRTAAGLVTAWVTPRVPVPVSRRSVVQSWAAFETVVDELLLHADWESLFEIDAPVTVFHGTADDLVDRNGLASVARRARVVEIDGADHHLAVTRPDLLFDRLEI